MKNIPTERTLAYKFPEVAKEWHPAKNDGLDFQQMSAQSHKKVWWKCTKGHEWTTEFRVRVSRGAGCPYCLNQKVSVENSLLVNRPDLVQEWNYAKNINIGPSEVSCGSSRRVWWICQHYHEWYTTIVNRTKGGTDCPNCYRVNQTNNILIKDPELVKEWHPTKNGTLTPETVAYQANQKVWWLGKCGHEWNSFVFNRARGKDCPYCCNVHTNLEKFVEDKLCTEKYNKNPLCGAFYKPDFRLTGNIYLNVDGLYWHSLAQKSKDYHYKLREAFELEHKRILQFYSDEIYNKWSIVESIINNTLKCTSVKINARDCNILTITQTDVDDFYRKNHLMGGCYLSKHMALLIEGKIIAAMSTRQTEGIIEISRFATRINTSVRGGFSKLLSHVIKLYKPTKVVSFCDLRYATGKSYEKLGFKLEHITQGWHWTDFKCRYNRLFCKATVDNTEQENANVLGLTKIYDAGQAKYVLEI